MRVLWLIVGLVSTACGIAGIVLPLVPTTPFLLLAAFAFARSHPPLYVWLVRHPRLGPPIRDWREHGAISARAKISSAVVMLATFLGSIAFGVSTTVLAIQAVVLGGAATFVLSRPTAPRS